MKKQLGPSWNQQWPPHSLHLLAIIIISSCISICSTAPVHETTDLEQYSGTCYYNYNHYNEGDRILTNEPCLNCTCHNQMLMCYLRVCPFTKPIGHDCVVEKREDQCCPIITCPDVPVELVDHKTDSNTEIGFAEKYGCYIENKFYPEGAQVPSNPNKPCELCYCIRNRTSCLMQECTLHVDGCQPIYNRGVCCPVRYDCEHDSIMSGGPYLEDSHTTVRPTEGFILTTSPSIKDSSTCVANGVAYADGALIPDTKPCEHCYCMKGDIVCAVRECAIPMQFPDGKTCEYLPPAEGECCPESYVCKNDDGTVVYGNIADAEQEFTSPPQVDSIVTTTALPAGLEEIEEAGVTETSDGLQHHKLHETVSEEDVQLQEHIDDIPKTSTVKPIEGGEEGLEGEAATTVLPTKNIKLAEEELSGAEITTQLPESQQEIEHGYETEAPASATESAKPATADLVTDQPHQQADEYTPISIQTESSVETTYSPPSEIVPIAIPGEGDCLYNSVTYKNNTDVPKITKCDEHCICLSSIIKCKKVECVVALGSNCRVVEGPDPEACCPTYACDGEEPLKHHVGEELPPTTISSLSVDQEESTAIGVEESGEKGQVGEEHAELPEQSQTEHGLPESMTTETLPAALPEHPEHVAGEHKEHEIEGTQQPYEDDLPHHAEEPEGSIETQTEQEMVSEYDHTAASIEGEQDTISQSEEQLLTGHADADRKEEGEPEHTELPIEKEPSVPQQSDEVVVPAIPSESETPSVPVESYEGSTETYLEPTQSTEGVQPSTSGLESEEKPASLPESTSASLPEDHKYPDHEASVPEEPEPEKITAPEDLDILQTTTELPIVAHKQPESQQEDHVAPLEPEADKEHELEQSYETTDKISQEPAEAGQVGESEQGAGVTEGTKVEQSAEIEHETQASIGAELGQGTESSYTPSVAHELELLHGAEETDHTYAPELSTAADITPSTEAGLSAESEASQEPEIIHEAEPEIIQEAGQEGEQHIPEPVVPGEEQKPDLDRKHFKPEEIPELTETTLKPLIESMSHVTTVHPAGSEQPIEEHMPEETIPHIPSSASDEPLSHIPSDEHKPAAGVSESTEPSSIQTEPEATEQPAAHVEGSGDTAQPEPTPGQQSETDKEITTDELMSAVLEILKGTAAPGEEQTDIIYETTEKGVEEPAKESLPAETPRPIDHTLAPEIIEHPSEDRTEVPQVDEEKLQEPIEGHVLPTEQPALKPTSEEDQTALPEEGLSHGAEHTPEEATQIPALQDEYTVPGSEQDSQTATPVLDKTDEQDVGHEEPQVPESVDVHHPSEDMIGDNLEGKPTVQPDIAVEQQTSGIETGGEPGIETIAPAEPTITTAHADEQPETHEEHPVKHTELVGTVEPAKPTESEPVSVEEYVPEVHIPEYEEKPETAPIDKETIEQSTDGQQISVTSKPELSTESIDTVKKEEGVQETATEVVQHEESTGKPDESLDKVTESVVELEHEGDVHTTEAVITDEKDITKVEGTVVPSIEQTADEQTLGQHMPEEHVSEEHIDKEHTTEGQISVHEIPQEHIPDEHAEKEHVPEEHISEEHTTEGQLLQEGVTQEPISQEHVTEEHIPQEHIPQEYIPEEHIPEKHIPEEHIPEEHIPEVHIPEEHIPEKHIPQEHIPQEHVPEEHIPQEHVTEEYIPEEHIPQEHIPQEHIPQEHIPQEHLPEEQLPGEQATAEQVPIEHIPDEHKSEEPISAEHIPEKHIPAEITPENLPEDVTEQQPHIPGESLSQEPTPAAPEESLTQQPPALPEEPISPEHGSVPDEAISSERPAGQEESISVQPTYAPEQPISPEVVAVPEQPALPEKTPESEESVSAEPTYAPEQPISADHVSATEQTIAQEQPALPEEPISAGPSVAPEQSIPEDHTYAPEEPVSGEHVPQLPGSEEEVHKQEEHTVAPLDEISETQTTLPEAGQEVHIVEDEATAAPEESVFVPEQPFSTDATPVPGDVHVSGDKLHEEHLPEEHLPEEHLPEEHLPEEHVSTERLPEEHVPSEHVPSEHVPSEHVPSEHVPSEHVPSEHVPSEHIPSEHLPEEHAAEEHLPSEASKPESEVPSVQTSEEGTTATYLEPEVAEVSTTVASISDEHKPEHPEGVHLDAIPESHTESDHVPESQTVSAITEAPTPQVEIVTASVGVSIKEETTESIAHTDAPELVDTLKTGDATSTVAPALSEESGKPEHAEPSSTEVAKPEIIEESTTVQAITEEKLPTEETVHAVAHDVHDTKPEEEVPTESQPTTIQPEVLEHKTESSPAAEEVTQKTEEVTQKAEEVTQKTEEVTQKIDEVTQKPEDVTQKIVTTEFVSSTTEIYEAENKTEGHTVGEAHETTSAPQPTPASHPLFPHRPHHPQHPGSQESFDHIDHGSHQAPTHPSSGHFAPSGAGSDSQGEGDFGPLPGGHYSSFGEDDYPEEEDPSAFGPGTCRYGGKLFVSAQQIPRDDPCDFCFCFRSDIICLQQSCPPPISGCHEEPISGFCCPRYECPVLMGGVLNLTTTTTTTTTVPPHFQHRSSELIKRTGCYIGGQTYKVGEAIQSASGPCIQCSCGGDGQMKCEPKVCTPEPMLRQMIAVVASRRR